MMNLKTISLKTLQPGFLVATYDPERERPNAMMIPKEVWEQMKARGFYGGLILREGIEIKSLTDEELRRVGLTRLIGVT